jgi:hypothetical protein
MKILLIIMLLVVSGLFGYAQNSGTWEGFVTDTHCGTNCQRTSTMTPDRACIRRCVKEGSEYGLWYGNHVYVLEPQLNASKFAGEHVRVTGDKTNDIIQITSITRTPQQKPQNQ